MKKLILTFLATLVMGFGLPAQNPTLVYGTDGLTMKPTNIHSGKVYVGLDTNLTGFASNTGIKWNGTAFVWDTFGGSGLPTNWTWSAANPSVLTNSIPNGAFTIANPGNFFLDSVGSIQFGRGTTDYPLQRDSSGQWGFVTTKQNSIITLGGALALRQQIRNATGNVNSTDNGIVNYCDASGGPITLTLPAVNVNPEKIFYFVKTDSTTNGVYFSGTVDQGVKLLSKGDSVMIHCDSAAGTFRVLNTTSYPKHWSQFHHEDVIVTGNSMVSAPDPLYMYNFVTYQSTAATNDQFRSYFTLKSGTYTFSALVTLNASHGIISWYVDDQLIGTNDLYAAVISRDNVRSIASVTITNSGTHKLEGRMISKNAASSDFYAPITKWWWTWTGD